MLKQEIFNYLFLGNVVKSELSIKLWTGYILDYPVHSIFHFYSSMITSLFYCRAAVQATQGLQYEHENLVRELDVLRYSK